MEFQVTNMQIFASSSPSWGGVKFSILPPSIILHGTYLRGISTAFPAPLQINLLRKTGKPEKTNEYLLTDFNNTALLHGTHFEHLNCIPKYS